MNGYCKNKKINFSAYNAEEKNHIKEYCGDIKMSATFDSGCRGSGQSLCHDFGILDQRLP